MPTMSNAHALVIGIANYQTVPSLPSSILNDALDIAHLLSNPAVCGYPAENVRLLLDSNATLNVIRSALADLAQHSQPESTVLVYFSGHGGHIEDGARVGEYLLPVDVSYTTEETLAQTAISGSEFAQAIKSLSSQRIVIILDCCHAGGIGQLKGALPSAYKSGLPNDYYDMLKQGRGRVILVSSRGNESAYVMPNAHNSLFTQHLLAGMRGGAHSDDGVIRIFDLFEYVQPRVTADQPMQHPIFKAEVEENFPIALYRGGKKSMAQQDRDAFRFDAYVSFADREPDASWVWKTLLPRLEAAGLRVAVSGDVEEPGVERVVNIERGILQSRRTVIVLSSLYLADNIAHFENVLAQTTGIQEGLHKLLPVMIEPIDRAHLPARIGMLSCINLSNTQSSERGFDRLISAMKQLPQTGE
jgi:hypothetical protein